MPRVSFEYQVERCAANISISTTNDVQLCDVLQCINVNQCTKCRVKIQYIGILYVMCWAMFSCAFQEDFLLVIRMIIISSMKSWREINTSVLVFPPRMLSLMVFNPGFWFSTSSAMQISFPLCGFCWCDTDMQIVMKTIRAINVKCLNWMCHSDLEVWQNYLRQTIF